MTTKPIIFITTLACLLSSCSWIAPVLKPTSNASSSSSQVYSSNGTLVTTMHGPINRIPVTYSQIPKVLKQSVVGIEDQRYWIEGPIDIKGMIRAAIANLKAGKIVQGGSTIPEQYVKNAFLDPGKRSLAIKIKEAYWSYLLSKRYSKKQILTDYLNTIYFGQGAYGVQSASEIYFNTSVSKLNLSQAALLAGMIHAPSATDPFIHPKTAFLRRKVVLYKLLALGWITASQASKANAEPLTNRSTPNSFYHYPAPFFVNQVQRFIINNPAFGPTKKARLKALLTKGLKIYTTLDLSRQKSADKAISEVIPKNGHMPSAALVSMDPQTGAVVSLVGGTNFFSNQPNSQFDLATQARRPAASSFKPFILAAALLKGISPNALYNSPSQITIPTKTGPWIVHNYRGEPTGEVTLQKATYDSINTVYAQLIMQVGPSFAMKLATQMGITSPLLAVPSSVLGSNPVSPFEMTAAYLPFANGGNSIKPYFVSKVTTRNGKVLYVHHIKKTRVLPRALVAQEDAVLEKVILKGTGINARIGRPAAGKTGTGQNWDDAWFMGFTPNLVTGVWTGFPQGEIAMVPPKTPLRITGGRWPAQIWQLYNSAALANVAISNFPKIITSPGIKTPLPTSGENLLPNKRNGVPMPSVLGMNVSQASALVKASQLNPIIIYKQDPPGAGSVSTPGIIWSQSPPSSSPVELDGNVTLFANPA